MRTRFPVSAALAAILSLCSLLSLADQPGHQPMLASVYRAGIPATEYWVSEKLDGVRGHWDGQALWTRGGHRISAPDWFTSGWPTMTMDGELWIDRHSFDEVSGIVRSLQPDDSAWRRVQFMVFDLPGHPGPFDERVLAMAAIEQAQVPWLQPVEQIRVSDVAELDRRLDAVIAAGGEGLMLHHGQSLYRAGRSAHLLKYKPYEDAEARVVGYTQGKGKYAGQVGALIVEDAGGRRFRLGSGLTDALRKAPPELGVWVTYRYNGETSGGLPRFARYLRVRSDMLGEQGVIQ